MLDCSPKLVAIDEEPAAYFAHASAFIDDEVEIGAGTTIWHLWSIGGVYKLNFCKLG